MESSLVHRVIELDILIQQIPAPTFHESERAAFIQQRFLTEGLQDVSMDDLGNVYARLPGGSEHPPLVVSAHLDTVFPESTDLQVRRDDRRIIGPGIGDNSLGVAGLFGLLWELRERQVSLPGDLWLVANVGEEGLGNLRGMQRVVDRFGDRIIAYLVLEGLALGQIYNRGLGVRRYRITVRTPGGHSWVDYGRPSAVHELAALVTQFAALPLPAQPRTTLNVGVISGGTTVNTIAARAFIDLDLRSEEVRSLENLSAWVETLVRKANRPDVEVEAVITGERPAGQISARHPLVRVAQQSLQSVGIEPNLSVGSTDANIPLSRELPAICIGLTSGGGAHTVDEYIEVAPLARGLEQLISIAQGVYQEL